MHKFEANIGNLVASDTQGTLKAFDTAILSELKLCTTLVEAMQESPIPIASSQKLLNSMSTGLSHMVAGRKEMASTVQQLTILQRDSNLAVYDFGCPNGSLEDAAQPASEPVSA
jgi:hypothetical protein